MNYQLVLQFPLDSIEDYDALIEYETKLMQTHPLRDLFIVDGHDAGNAEMNLFLHTNDPRGSLKALLAQAESPLLIEMKAGYRELNPEADYQPLWPESLTEFTIQ